MAYTVQNQNIVTIHREAAKSDFLGIKNENWQAAARDLGAHALMLYMYLAANANGYVLALSPAAIKNAIGMARSTYYDQLDKLIKKGYLVQTSGNGYEFYEVSQIPKEKTKKSMSADGLKFCECANAVQDNESAVQFNPAGNREINNINITNKTGTNISNLTLMEKIEVPKEVEVHISVPQSKPKKDLMARPQRKDFIF